MVHCLLYLTKKALSWEKIFPTPENNNKTILDYKKKFNYYDWCGGDLEYLADILEYIKMLEENNHQTNYNII